MKFISNIKYNPKLTPLDLNKSYPLCTCFCVKIKIQNNFVRK